jgi:Domain of unknown function (DUF5615)
MKLLFDESLSPRLILLLRDLFPESESALRNGLARTGDRAALPVFLRFHVVRDGVRCGLPGVGEDAPGAAAAAVRAPLPLRVEL